MAETRRSANLRTEGQSNDDPNVGAEYPRMMYRKTTEELRVTQTDANAKCGATWLVENKFDNLLCDTQVVNDRDEMEELAADGWDISPKAAHGIADGAQVAVSAKDARIAELEAILAERDAKRGPGRPPTVRTETVDAA